MGHFFNMRWNVNDIYQLFLKLAKKNQAGGISAGDLFYTWNAEQMSYHQDIVGRWQTRANGKTGVNTGMVLNETILSELAPFTIQDTLAITSGNSDKPTDFIYRVGLRIGGYKVDVINHGQIPSVTSSVIDPPSVVNNTYYAIEYEDYYSFLPNTVTAAVLDYVAAPEDIKWGFTFDADDRQVYNSGTSVQPKWNNNVIITITKRAFVNLGVGFKDNDFMNYGRTAQASGD